MIVKINFEPAILIKGKLEGLGDIKDGEGAGEVGPPASEDGLVVSDIGVLFGEDVVVGEGDITAVATVLLKMDLSTNSS